MTVNILQWTHEEAVWLNFSQSPSLSGSSKCDKRINYVKQMFLPGYNKFGLLIIVATTLQRSQILSRKRKSNKQIKGPAFGLSLSNN